ncbi:hypothetical protein LCGC14_2842540 [marine sediment metagenome]|uniref:CopG-like ribbon-helix-helix domain-containing protein n=1 Tax=marine sediment metagenome TaxID=412755 RepID=A0A0F8YXI2_9ZZZZ
MGQKYCKKLNLEIPHELHAEIKKQAQYRNITIRKLILRYILPNIVKNKNIYDTFN